MKKILLALCVIAVASTNAQTIRYITQNGAGLKNGSSWTNAGDSSMIQSFINAATAGDNIWVAAGTYKPTAYHPQCTSCGTARQYTFALKSRVSLYGGFNGTETLVTQAAPSANPTILSGNIGSATDSTDNIARIITAIDISDTTVIKGFTISGAYSVGNTVTINGVSFSNGGGVLVYNSSLRIKNCIVEHCTSNYGAGVYYECSYLYTGGILTVDSCVVQYNTHDGGAIAGDAIYYDGSNVMHVNGSIYLYNSTFRSNKHRTTTCIGGAVYASCPLNVDKCLFTGNDAYYTPTGGGAGGAIYSSDVSCHITNSVFANNTAGDGGAIWRSLDRNTVTLDNCVFYNNVGRRGGAFFAHNWGLFSATYCTFYGNSASNEGSIFYTYTNLSLSGDCLISKGIVWGNTLSSFYGGDGSYVSNSVAQQAGLGGINIIANPQFADSTDPDGPDNIWMTSDDGFMPTCSSPALDAITGTGGYDIVGTARPQGTGREMGAYEKIPVGVLPTLNPIVQTPSPGCAIDSTTFTVAYTNAGNNYTYQWKAGNVAVNGNTFSLKAVVNNGTGITYTLTSPDYCVGGHFLKDTFTTVVLPSTSLPQPNPISGSTVVCSGTAQTYSIASVTGAARYTWSYSGIGNLSDTGTSVTFTPTSSGTLSVVAVNNCATSVVRSLVITTNDSIQSLPNSILGNVSVCSGRFETYSISAVSGATSYTWSLPLGWSGSSVNNSIITITGSSGGIIAVTANNICGTSLPSVLSVSSNQTPSVSVSPASITICTGGSGTTLQATGTGQNYNWSNGSSGQSVTVNPSTTTTYTVTATNGNCSATTAATVTVNSPVVPGVTVNANKITICPGETVTFTATPTNGGSSPSYVWYKNGSSTGSAANPYSTSSISNGDVFTVQLTSNGSCVSPTQEISLPVTITVSSTITPMVTATANKTSICQGEPVTFTAMPTNGGTSPSYVWYKNGTSTGSAANPYSTSSIANGDAFTVRLTSNASCANPSQVTSAPVAITISSPSTPVISQSGNVLTSNSPMGNQWYLNGSPVNGATGQNYTPVISGNYTVIVTSGSCTSQTSNVISVTISGIEELTEESISVYPNPATNQLTINLSSLQAEQVNIYNVDGKLQSQTKQPANNRIDISNLANGVYIAEIKTKEGSVKRRWVKM